MDHGKRTITGAGCDALIEYVPPVVWMSEYELGIPIIDMQHQGLLTTINSLHFAIANELGQTILEPTIEMVKAYASIHFITEEFFFTHYGFPGSKHHIELHKALLNTMFDVGQESVVIQDPGHFLQFLTDWLIQHILGEDRKYRDYFARHVSAKAP